MNQLLSDPIFQSAIAPFAAALIIGVLLNLVGGGWTGLAVTIGFYVSAWLVAGLKLFPLTSTHKILLLGFAAAAVGIILDLYKGPRRYVPALMFVAGAAAAIWVLWPVLTRREGSALWFMAGGAGLYAGWVTAFGDGLRTRPLAAGSVALSLALGTGVSAVFGASALLGQLASSIAAGAGAFLLLGVLMSRQCAGATLSTPIMLLCGLFGVAASVYAKLPWYSLLPLAVIAPLGYIPLRAEKPAWMRALALLLITLPAAVIAILTTRHVTGSLPPF
jgi:hypothetical protein